VQVVEASRFFRQLTALRTSRLYPREISTYIGEWPLPVDASTDTLYLVINNRPRSYIGPSTCVEMTFTGTYIIAFTFCTESLVLQVQNRYYLYCIKSTFMAGPLTRERTTSLMPSALDTSLSALFGPALKKYRL